MGSGVTDQLWVSLSKPSKLALPPDHDNRVAGLKVHGRSFPDRGCLELEKDPDPRRMGLEVAEATRQPDH